MAKACAVCGRIAVEANMGAIGAVMAYGSPAQQRLAAGLVLAGDKPAICITEPEAGSAATDMTTRAVRHGDNWVSRRGEALDHRRRRLPPAPDLRPRLREPGRSRHRRLPGGAGRGGTAGLVIHRRIPSMGLKGMPEAEIHFAAWRCRIAMVLRRRAACPRLRRPDGGL